MYTGRLRNLAPLRYYLLLQIYIHQFLKRTTILTTSLSQARPLLLSVTRAYVLIMIKGAVHGLRPRPMPYYAVRSGRHSGVYNSWNECEQNVRGYSGARYAKFDTVEEARQYVNGSESLTKAQVLCGDSEIYDANSDGHSSSRRGRYSSPSRNDCSSFSGPGHYFERPYYEDKTSHAGGSGSGHVRNYNQKSSGRTTNNEKLKITEAAVPGATVVYTDGACRGNGYAGARAGYGVHFPKQPHLDLQGALPPHMPQTNQRAELTAIKRALQQTQDVDEPVEIRTDSRYSIDCSATWSKGWEKKGWPQDKKNLDLVQDIVRLARNRTHPTYFRHVPGHTGEPGNERADSLARDACNQDHHYC